VIKGNFMFGLNVLIFRVHPMRAGATVMSSFLFNVALILLASTATIQFAATAFALYANGTAILDIYGNTVRGAAGAGGVDEGTAALRLGAELSGSNHLRPRSRRMRCWPSPPATRPPSPRPHPASHYCRAAALSGGHPLHLHAEHLHLRIPGGVAHHAGAHARKGAKALG
jgi:hypothetical protein